MLLSLASWPAFGQDKPMMITSDTAEYCEELQLRVSRTGPGSPDVQHLVAEGRKMCDHGEIRGGIVRLRRALIMQRRQAKQPHS